MKRHSWRLLSLAAATTTVITVMGAASAAASQASPAPSPSQASPAPSPVFPVFTGRLYGVTATSPGNAWAVGLHPDSSLIIHWDGRTWTQQLAGPGYFWSVGASSAGNAWAVGGTDWFTSQTMTYHWDGTAWTHIPSPTPAATASLSGVTVSGNEAWAVGATGASPGNPDLSHASPLIEHWDGTAWKVMPTPPLHQAGQLSSVTAVSSHNIWAVGWIGSGLSRTDSFRPLIEHWKGRSWFRVHSPAVPAQSVLTSVTATGYRHVWAVGATNIFGATKTLIERWDGSTWSPVPSPTPDSGAHLKSVSATSSGDAWAVGQTTYNGVCPPAKCQTVIEHGDGTPWSVIPSPNPPSTYLNSLWGVSAITRDDAWAVGTTDYATTLILHWDGNTWK